MVDPPASTIAGVRRSLAEIRARWGRHSPREPMYIDADLSSGTSLTKFAFTFIIGHHTRPGAPASK